MLRQKVIKNMKTTTKNINKIPPNLDMFLMVERKNFKTINVKM